MRTGVGASLKRSVIFVHRWLGVGLCVVFLLWFLSGIGMMYWDFPSVTVADRLERSPALDASQVRLSPEEAYAKVGFGLPPNPIRLNSFDGRPVYRFGPGRYPIVVYADAGEQQINASPELMLRVASAWTRQPADAARVERIGEVDQWTVQGIFRSSRPLWKYSWRNGDEVYVSETSGEVVQYTTTASRLGAYVGAIPHWLYFTSLRKHQAEWSRLVIWASAVGTIAALLGVALGFGMYSPARRYRYAGVATSIPYRGQKRWHMVLGLIFGLGAATWAFSGMLSMEPFPSLSGAQPGARGEADDDRIVQALGGGVEFSAYAARHPREALQQVAPLPVKELELASFAGEPAYLAVLAGGDTRIVPMDGPPRPSFDVQRLFEIVTNAAQPYGVVELRVLDQYDAHYLDRRRQRPLPVIRARLNDPTNTRYYIDPRTGRVVGRYSSAGWVNRWLYHGLHSLNFPWLYNHRPLWDIVVMTFMVGGTALCLTSLILAWRVVGKALGRSQPGTNTPGTAVSDDLAIEAD